MTICAKPAVRTRRPASIDSFNSLPDIAGVRLPFVQALYGVSRATVWRWVSEGRIPAPRKHGPATTVWLAGELRADLAAKAGK